MNKKIFIPSAIGLAVITIYIVLSLLYHFKVKDFLDEALYEIEDVEISYGDLDTSLLSQTITLTDVIIYPDSIKTNLANIDELIIDSVQIKHDSSLIGGRAISLQRPPQQLSLKIEGIHVSEDLEELMKLPSRTLGVNVGANEEIMEFVTDLLEDELTFNLSFSYEFHDAARKEADVAMMLGIVNVGQIDISAGLDHLPRKLEKLIAGSIQRVKLGEASLTIQDENDAFMQMIDFSSDESEGYDEFIEQLEDAISELEEEGASESSLALLEEIHQFVTEPEQIAISISPKSPLSFGKLLQSFQKVESAKGKEAQKRATESLIRKLNLNVEAN